MSALLDLSCASPSLCGCPTAERGTFVILPSCFSPVLPDNLASGSCCCTFSSGSRRVHPKRNPGTNLAAATLNDVVSPDLVADLTSPRLVSLQLERSHSTAVLSVEFVFRDGLESTVELVDTLLPCPLLVWPLLVMVSGGVYIVVGY